MLRLRRDTPAFRAQRRGGVDGAVLAPHAFLLRYFAGRPDEERVLLINLGGDLCVRSFAEPLLAPPDGCEWTVEWSTESPCYGGGGTRDIRPEGRWALPAASALVLAPVDKAAPTMGGRPRRTA